MRVNFCVCDPLVWDTHMRPLKHKSSFGKEAKVEKEQRRGRKEKYSYSLAGARGGGQGRAAALLMYPREGLSLGLEERGGKTGSLASGLSLLQQVGCWQFSLNAWVSAQR